MTTVLVIGATAAIAQATAAAYAAEGARLFLVGRDAGKLAAVADDLRVRGASVAGTYALDLTAIAGHAAMLDAATAALGTLDAALIAYGTLGDQAACEASVEATLREWATNCTSVIALLTPLANIFAAQRHGTIAVVTSVAGDRGRASNYVYGAAKGALNIFLEGLRGRLAKVNVRVVTVKPGLVDTPMTAHLTKGPLFAAPSRVGADIHRAMTRGADTVYTPWFWRGIMAVIKAIPERLFKKVSL